MDLRACRWCLWTRDHRNLNMTLIYKLVIKIPSRNAKVIRFGKQIHPVLAHVSRCLYRDKYFSFLWKYINAFWVLGNTKVPIFGIRDINISTEITLFYSCCWLIQLWVNILKQYCSCYYVIKSKYHMCLYFVPACNVSGVIHKSDKIFKNSNLSLSTFWENLAAILNYFTNWWNLAC